MVLFAFAPWFRYLAGCGYDADEMRIVGIKKLNGYWALNISGGKTSIVLVYSFAKGKIIGTVRE